MKRRIEERLSELEREEQIERRCGADEIKWRLIGRCEALAEFTIDMCQSGMIDRGTCEGFLIRLNAVQSNLEVWGVDVLECTPSLIN